MKTPSFTERDTALSFWLDDPKDPEVMETCHAMVDHLRGRGFTLELDKNVDPIIREGHYIGRKGDLEVYVETFGRSLKVEFFQNIVRENRNGGRYDFDKRAKMPYLIRMQYLLEVDKLAEMMRGRGHRLEREVTYHGKDKVAHRRAEWMASHGPTFYTRERQSYNVKSADGCIITDGDQVFVKHWNGRIEQGVAYYDANSRWMVLQPSGEVRYVSCWEIYLSKPEFGLRGRHFTDSERLKRQMDAQHKARKNAHTRRIEALRELLTPEHPCYVISMKHTKKTDRYITLWGQSGSGYSWSFTGAGKYARQEIMAHLDHYNGGLNIAVDAETVERLATLADDNDPDLQRTAILRNTPAVWYTLLANTVAKPKYEAIPLVLQAATKRKKAA